MEGTRSFRQHFNGRLFFVCALISLSPFNYGFDNQGYATTQAMDAFQKQFGWYNAETDSYYLETSWLSLFSSLQYITFATGVFVGSMLNRRFGRRLSLIIMSCWAMVTATIAITAQHREQIMAARILNYLYIGVELSVVPVYLNEIVPHKVRGTIVSTYQLSLISGQLVINGVCRGTSGMSSSAAFRIPYGLFYVIPTLVLSGIFFVPESPVWLVSKGRFDDARKSLRLLRAGPYSDDEIDEIFEQTKAGVEVTAEKSKFIEVFKGVHLKRTLIVMTANFFQQATGQSFASQYGTLWMKSLHTVSAFNMTLINVCCDFVLTIIAISLADRVGRKPLLYVGTSLQTGSLLTMAILSCVTPNTPKLQLAIVSMLTIAQASFCIGLATLIYVVSTEVPSERHRDHTVRAGFLTKVVTNFVVAFSIPYIIRPGYGNLSGKIGFIFGTLCALSLVFVFFCVPECKGKTAEEIELMFQHGVPIRKFKTFDTSTLIEANRAEEEDLKKGQGTKIEHTEVTA